MATEVTADPRDLAGWSDVDSEVCSEALTVTIGEATYQLHCEMDAGHDPSDEPHAGTVRWIEGGGE